MLKNKKEKIKLYLILFLLIIYLLTLKNTDKELLVMRINNNEINNYIIPFKDTFFAKLEIPTISLNENLVHYQNKNNNVNKNVEIIFPSEMPDKSNSILILAAHSGNSSISYFKDLSKLQKDNYAYITYNNILYKYKVITIERQNKNGSITVNKNKDKTILVLTTCDQIDKTKQIVIILELINVF